MRIKKYNIRKHCDDLWSELVKLRAGGKCEKCWSTNVVQSHHVVPRTNWNLRFDPENGVALCKKDHLWWAHKDALEFAYWFGIKYPDRIGSLELKRHNKARHDYTLIKLDLENEIRKFK